MTSMIPEEAPLWLRGDSMIYHWQPIGTDPDVTWLEKIEWEWIVSAMVTR